MLDNEGSFPLLIETLSTLLGVIWSWTHLEAFYFGVCIYVFACAWTSMWKLEANVQFLPLICLYSASPWICNLAWLARLIGQQGLDSCLHFSYCWNYTCMLLACYMHAAWHSAGTWLRNRKQDSMLCAQYFVNWAFFPAHIHKFCDETYFNFSFVLTGCWTPGKEGIAAKMEVLIPDQIANRAILLKWWFGFL